ncbi:hypothetical protein V6Z11_A07G161200 [Gossypium hirsutum]
MKPKTLCRGKERGPRLWPPATVQCLHTRLTRRRMWCLKVQNLRPSTGNRENLYDSRAAGIDGGLKSGGEDSW